MTRRDQAGARVFVPGARCFGDGARPVRRRCGPRGGARRSACWHSDEAIGEQGVLLALAATAQHAVVAGDAPPDLIVGHGVLGRLLARFAVIAGGNPVVWERNPARCGGAEGYEVRDPEQDAGSLYGTICDASGAADLIDGLVQRLTPGGEIVLAGFYTGRLSFAFAPAFMREARLRIAAQWSPADLAAVRGFVASGQLSLDGLITHRSQAMNAPAAYRTAFEDSACLKMVLDWRDCA